MTKLMQGNLFAEPLKKTFANCNYTFTLEQFEQIMTYDIDDGMQKKWKAFTKKINTKTDDYTTVLKTIKTFVDKPFAAAIEDTEYTRHWFAAIVGSSGSGKTTLLNLIGGLDCPYKGMVYINDIPICNMDEEELSVFRRRNIGFVFQNYNLIPVLTAYENIVLPTGNLDSKNSREVITLVKTLASNNRNSMAQFYKKSEKNVHNNSFFIYWR